MKEILIMIAVALLILFIIYKVRNRNKKPSASFFGEDSWDEIFYTGGYKPGQKDNKKRKGHE
ncbi:MAG: hypothetical protein ABW007_19055 [Chitinophagaceae bacterium]